MSCLEPHLTLCSWSDKGQADQPFSTLKKLLASGGDLANELKGALGSPYHRCDRPSSVATQLAERLATVATARTVILFMDDAQWVDAQSAESLAVMFRQLTDQRVLMVVASRTEQVRSESLGCIVNNDERARMLVLRGLPPEELYTLAQALGARHFGLAAARRICDGGLVSPLQAVELLTQLDRWVPLASSGEFVIPRSIVARWSSLVESCGPMARALIEAVAVLGLDVSVLEAAKLAGIGDVTAELQRAVVAGILIESAGRVGFIDSVAPIALRQAMGPSACQALNRKAVQQTAGERQLSHRVAIARLCTEQAASLAGELEDLGIEEARSGALGKAVGHLSTSADLTVDPADRARRRELVTELALAYGDVAQAEMELREVQSDTLDGGSFLRGKLAWLSGDAVQAHDVLALAWAEASRGNDQASADIASTLAEIAVSQGAHGQAETWAALTHGGSTSAIEVANLAGLVSQAQVGPVSCDLGLDGKGHDREQPARAASLLRQGLMRMWSDEFLGAGQFLQAAVAAARLEGDRSRLLGYCLAALSDLDYRSGQWDSSIVHSEGAAALAATAGRACDSALFHAVACWPLSARGDWAGAEAHIEAASCVTRRYPVAIVVAYVERAKATLSASLGDPEAQLSSIARSEDAWSSGEPAFFPGGAVESEALTLLGRLDEAAESLGRFERQAVEGGRRSALASVAHVRGLMLAQRGDRQAAGASFRAGLTLLEGLDLRFGVARLHLDYGVWLRASGSLREGATQLAKARALFADLRATPWLRACTSANQSSRKSPTLGAGLTACEARVARLVAEGKSTREVAKELVVGNRTVEFHISNVYAKLGVSNRVQLANLLGRNIE